MFSSARSGMLPPTSSRAALRLASGRTLPARVRRVEDDGSVTVEAVVPSLIKPGLPLELCWSESRDWFSLPVRVRSVDDAAAILSVEPVARSNKDSNRRRNPRYPLAIGLKVVVERGSLVSSGQTIRTVTIDVSLSGVSFESELPLQRGDRVRVSLMGDEGQLGQDTPGVVRWTASRAGSHGLSVGILFERPADSLVRALRQQIAQRC
jgi:hypothetical protein